MITDLIYVIYFFIITTIIFFLSKFIFKKYYSFSKKYNLISNQKVNEIKGGGVIYAVILLFSSISLDSLDFVDFKKLSPEIGTSLLIVFFGFYRDVLRVSTFQKYIVLTFFVSMLIYSSAIDLSNYGIINNLNGFLGFHKLSAFSSSIITFLFYLFVINALNHTKAISGYTSIFSVVFFISTLLVNNYTLNTISAILIGVSFFFIYCNYFYSKRLLLGDSGSLYLGFWIAYFLIQFVNTVPDLNLVSVYSVKLENIPIITLSLVNIIVYDSIRVVFIRLIKLKSPFNDDKVMHFHHILLESGMSERRISFFLTFINSFNFIVIFLIEPYFNSKTLTLIFVFIGLLWYLFFEYLNFKNLNFLKD